MTNPDLRSSAPISGNKFTFPRRLGSRVRPYLIPFLRPAVTREKVHRSISRGVFQPNTNSQLPRAGSRADR